MQLLNTFCSFVIVVGICFYVFLSVLFDIKDKNFRDFFVIFTRWPTLIWVFCATLFIQDNPIQDYLVLVIILDMSVVTTIILTGKVDSNNKYIKLLMMPTKIFKYSSLLLLVILKSTSKSIGRFLCKVFREPGSL